MTRTPASRSALLLGATFVAIGCSQQASPAPSGSASEALPQRLREPLAPSGPTTSDGLPSVFGAIRSLAQTHGPLDSLIALRGVGGFRAAPAGGLNGPVSSIDGATQVHLGTRASDPVRFEFLGEPSRTVLLTAMEATAVPVLVQEGRALFADALSGADLLWLTDESETWMILTAKDAAVQSVRLRLETGEGFAAPVLRDGGLVLSDRAGSERFHWGPAHVYDAAGKVVDAEMTLSGGVLSLRWSSTGLVYPVALLASAQRAPAKVLALPAQIKARVMVLVDTSGSMSLYFHDPAAGDDFPGGDGSTSYTDIHVTNTYAYPGKDVAGVRQGQFSRLFAAKKALRNAVSAYSGTVDFGLMAYDFALCPFSNPLCEQCTSSALGYNCLYADNVFINFAQLNWASNGCTTQGARILVNAASTSGPAILPWIDNVENHTTTNDGNNAYGTGSSPKNPELRADGSTPLAASINQARTGWFNAIKAADTKLSCRPYSLVVLTDGAESCGGNPVAAATSMTGANPGNPVLTYVIGVSINPTDQTSLNSIAAAGGTTSARFATTEADIEAAFADIMSKSVKYEVCNGLDDNCNALIDEGLGVYQECAVSADCTAGATCTAGRCACATNAQCAAGFACATLGLSKFCVPSCSQGVGTCARTGVRKCSAQGNDCCANDGKVACTVLQQGLGGTEICNGLDDNCNGLVDEGGVCQNCTPQPEVCNGKDDDCDGAIDNALVDVGKPCGLNVGECKPGTTACQPTNGQPFPNISDALLCSGSVGPKPEVCNGLDDNCDGVVDGQSQDCYSGPAGTSGVGACLGGQQACQAVAGSGNETWGPCVGELIPKTEVCNGIDDDCDGTVDNVAGAGDPCCPLGSPQGPAPDACNKGICSPGALQCQGGSLACVGGKGAKAEVCNNEDDDCNGQIDDGVELADPNVGKPCDLLTDAGTKSCTPGKTACVAGIYACQESPGGTVECPSGQQCLSGACREPCHAGEFPCPGGQLCVDHYCYPAGAVDAGTTEGGSPDGSAEDGSSSTGGAAGDAGSDASAGIGGTGGGVAGSGGSPAGKDAAGPDADEIGHYGLATGGGGCSCEVTPTHQRPWGMAFVLGLAAAGLARRGRKGGAR